MAKKVILFTLQTFSNTGGLQKMTRTLAYSLYQIAKIKKWDFNLWSLYDADDDLRPQYLPAKNFRGFKNMRFNFILNGFKNGLTADVVIISHINLAIVGLLIKLFKPKCQVWLVAHGIEVWRPISVLKKAFLKKCDKVLCVSNFTKTQIVKLHHLDPSICEVLNNAIDPFLKLPDDFAKPQNLVDRYQLNTSSPIIFTLTRLASTEQYKGHEQVIKVIGQLKARFPGIKYILAGQYDEIEEKRIKALITDNKVEEQVLLTGFIDEDELSDHFLLADVFVLPSKKEGFGIVFIEALACGLPVVCGNADGSVDAICNGKLGRAINADNLNELETAITESLTAPLTNGSRQLLQEKCLLQFNEHGYRNSLEQMIYNG